MTGLRPVPDTDAGPPHDPHAERALIGAAVLDPAAVALVDRRDFYLPKHETLWAALAAIADTAADPKLHDRPLALVEHLRSTGDLTRAGGAPYILECVQDCVTPAAAPQYADLIRRYARLRRIADTGRRLMQLAERDADLAEDAVIDAALALEDTLTNLHGGTPGIHVRNVREFLDAVDPGHDWIIPGLLERHDRVILTAEEGAGKSTLGRQLAVTAASGVHPFTGDHVPPIRVLLLDLENSEHQVRREISPLVAKAAHGLDPDLLRVEVRLAGVDLLGETDDRTWVGNVCKAARPDLIVTGPLYKMAAGNPNAEDDSKPVALFLDRIRAEHRCALWIEAHVGNETNGQKKRPERPVGWSGWRRWPEFGLFLREDGALRHWRGDRDRRDWPGTLQRGGAWPWTVAASPSDVNWQKIRQEIEAAGTRPSNRELARTTGIPETTVRRVVGERSLELEGILARLRGDT